MNYRTIEAINQRLDIEHPDPHDLVAISDELASKASSSFFGFGTEAISAATEYYARTYRGSFPFMCDMHVRAELGQPLTKKHRAAILNCMIAQAKRDLKRIGDR